jgi:superfamily II DNA/RNA helicase
LSSESEGEEEGEAEQDEGKTKKRKPEVFDSVKALILSPTRELAIQIKDMINAVIPIDYQE